jgi:hypothetical protein
MSPEREHRSSADVATDNGGRYLKQLCRHFGHKQESGWTGDDGFIAFAFGRCDLHARPSGLRLEVAAADAESLARVEHVVASHLQRFAFREDLAVDWQS